MSGRRRGAARAAPLMGLALLLAAQAGGVEQVEVLQLRAQRLLAADRCAEALPLLERARRAGADDARLHHLIGQCELRQGRDLEAIAALEEARRRAPQLPDLDLHRGIAYFHSGDLEGAESALAEAARRSPGRAEVDLYRGLVALRRAQNAEAALLLERARRSDPLAVEPLASYYAGLAWRAAEQESEARAALERVKQQAPDSPWAQAAERSLERAPGTRGLRDRRDVRGQQQAERPLGSLASLPRGRRWLSFSVGAEYDDNVVLRGSGVELPEDISEDSDERLVWTAEIGAELWRNPDWTLGVIGAYYGSAHRELEEFNVQYPSITLWLDRRLSERSTARLQYDFGYAWVDADPYLLAHSFTPALFHDWRDAGTTRLFAELTWNNFLFSNDDVLDGTGGPGDPCPGGAFFCGPFGLNEESQRNRDGFGSVIGIDHVIGVDALHSELRGGYRYHRYSSRGREYSYQGHELRPGSRSQLPLDLTLDLQASYLYKPYRHASTFPEPEDVLAGALASQAYRLSDKRRREEVLQLDVILERPITDWLLGSLRYSYVDNRSNRDVYDYDRNIFGAFLTFRFGP